MNRNAFLVAAFVLALGLPAFAGSRPQGDDAGLASVTIQAVSASLDALRQTDAASGVVRPRGVQRLLSEAQDELELASRDYVRGAYRSALRHADRAARLAWQASDPRKER